ncbi:hypothetical protein LIT32_12380 [Bacillus sp. CMF21]|nr:hypothetical protein LIT32_12380 [Bacillus sp. CMF21]
MTQKIQKNFKGITEETVKSIENFANEVNMGHGEFLEEMVNVYRKKRMADDSNGTIPKNLRSQFKNDAKKIENFTRAIHALFIGQMENISAERTTWEREKGIELGEKEVLINHLSNDFERLEGELVSEQEEKKQLAIEGAEIEKRLADLQIRLDEKERLIQSKDENLNQNKKTIEDTEGKILELKKQLEESREEIKKLHPVILENAELLKQIEEITSSHQNEINFMKQKGEIERERAVNEKIRELTEEFSRRIEIVKQEAFDKAYDSAEKRYLKDINTMKESNQKEIEKLQSRWDALAKQLQVKD